MILTGTFDSYKNLTLFLQEPYLIPKRTLHDSCKNLTWSLQEPYMILTGTLNDFYKNLTWFLHQFFTQSCSVLAWILHGLVLLYYSLKQPVYINVTYDAHTLRKTLNMTRMAFFLRYGRLEAVSVRTSFAKSLQMGKYIVLVMSPQIASLQIFVPKA